MKLLLRILRTLAFSLISVIILTYTILSIRYTPTYMHRLISMGVADVYDYQHFENRTIKAATDALRFEENQKAEYVESLFDLRVKKSGMNSFREWADQSQTTAIIVLRRDTIIYEKYFNGFSRDSYYHSQSVAKSFISYLIGVAIDDGLIQNVDAPMTLYVPELMERDPRYQDISIRHLLEMRSGLAYDSSRLPYLNIQTPWNDEVVGYYHPQMRSWLLNNVSIDRAPGIDYEYNNYNTSYLGLILERATGTTVSDYLEQKLWSKIMEYDALFSLDSEPSGFEYMPSRLIARAIDYARFGRLMLQGGEWQGERLVSEQWIHASTREDSTISRESYPSWFGRGERRIYYGYHWWGHAEGDSTYQYYANGNLGQNIYIIPDKDAVIVHCGQSLEHYSGDFDLWDVAREL